METVFKVGMKVYDQVVFPNKEGKVVAIVENGVFPIRVSLGDPNTVHAYTFDGKYGLHLYPTLSTAPYRIEGFEQKSPAPEFHDALEWIENNKDYQTVFEDERTYPSKEICEAFEALRKLIILREYYNEGWQPDWEDSGNKYCIILRKGVLTTAIFYFNFEVLYFKSIGIRDKFLEEQRELLEIAKPLL
jgi:hypothetical protein